MLKTNKIARLGKVLLSSLLAISLLLVLPQTALAGGEGADEGSAAPTDFNIYLSTGGNGTLAASLSNGHTTLETGDKLALTPDASVKNLYHASAPGTPDSVTADETVKTINVKLTAGATMIEVTATPDSGYVFDKLVDSAGNVLRSGGANNHYYFFLHDLQKVSNDITLTAYFAESGSVPGGTPVDFEQYMVSFWRSSQGGTITVCDKFSDIQEPTDLGFEEKAFDLGTTKNIGYGLRKDMDIILTATPGDGYVFAGWYDGDREDSTLRSSEPMLKFTVTKEDLYVAIFKPSGAAAGAADCTSLLMAKPTASAVLINGESVSFDAYNISDNNYFKLRDLAYVLSATEKQFEIGWDAENNAISLTSGVPYTAVGGEMSAKEAGDKIPETTRSKIYLDGKEVTFTAYNIGGNNYFKLRDIGAAFDFGVDWDGANNTIVIDTGKSYSE